LRHADPAWVELDQRQRPQVHDLLRLSTLKLSRESVVKLHGTQVRACVVLEPGDGAGELPVGCDPGERLRDFALARFVDVRVGGAARPQAWRGRGSARFRRVMYGCATRA